MTDPIRDPGLPKQSRHSQDAQAKLRQLSQDLEATFLSEMLGYAGLGEMEESFGGGAGERQFASFLRQEQATAMVKAGGIGLAETLFHAMAKDRT
jgi:Rod binding domain-containing protein